MTSFKEYERVVDQSLSSFAEREGFRSSAAFYTAVLDAQDENTSGVTGKMISLLLAAADYQKYFAMMKKMAGGDEAACERRAAFFRRNA